MRGDQLPYRFVVDLQATQNHAHGERGVARTVREHARSLVQHGCVAALALNPNLPFPHRLDGDLLTSPHLRWNTLSQLRQVAQAADRPLAYYLASPFEVSAHAEGDVPPHVLRGSVPLVVTLYDLIPLVFAERYLREHAVARRYRARAELLHQADLVLSISAHSARDAAERLGMDEHRIKVIGAGVSPFFRPASPGEVPELLLRHHFPSVTRAFVLTVTGGDERKNTERLLEAWAALPGPVRAEHQLVLAGNLDPPILSAWEAHARAVGIEPDEAIFTGWTPDEVLRALYQRATLFVFPSLYEGFGLPAAEAMACGCPTITSSTSSLPEVMAWPPSTFDPSDVDGMAAAVERGLTDEPFRAELRSRARERARALTWEAVGDRMVEALSELPPPTTGRTALPLRLALVGPMPPNASGIADYNFRLLPHLARRCELDVFSPSPRPNDTPAPGVRWFTPAALGRVLNPWSYDAVIYSIGNSDDHHDLYELAQEFPGVLWMHDVRLPGLYLTYARERVPEERQRDFLIERLERQYRRRLARRLVLDVTAAPPDYVDAGIGMSKELVDQNRAVVVGSDVARHLLALDQQPDARSSKVWVVPLAVPPALPHRAPPTEPVVVSFGIVSPVKAPDLLIHALARACADGTGAGMAPVNTTLVFVGLVDDGQRAQLEALAQAWGVADRVVLSGFCPPSEYEEWLRRAACAVQLRRSTNGESSAAVQECIANGIPVITNVASAAELPSGVVDLVPYDVEADELADHLVRLLTDRDAVQDQRAAQAAYAASWGFEEVVDRLLEVVDELSIWASGSR